MINCTVLAVRRGDDIIVNGVTCASLCVSGYGMRSILYLLMALVAACGSYAVAVSLSEIEATVYVPCRDGDAVFRALCHTMPLSR